MANDFLFIGLTITVILIAVSGLYNYVNIQPDFDTGIRTSDTYSAENITADVETLDLTPDSNVSTGNPLDAIYNFITSNPVTAPLGFIPKAISGVSVAGKYVFEMAFGWANLIDDIVNPIGLSGIGLMIKAILGFIEIMTIFFLVLSVVGAIAGRFT